VSAMNNADLFSDVTLMVEGKPVFCHRLMLTSSCSSCANLMASLASAALGPHADELLY
jgi:hypothetical protein